jgi:hypothetical protein
MSGLAILAAARLTLIVIAIIMLEPLGVWLVFSRWHGRRFRG